MHVELKKFAALTAAERHDWACFQASDPAFDSPFFRPEFTAAVDAIRDDVEVAVLHDGGGVAGFFPFQRTTPRYARPVGGRLSDYQGVIGRRGVEWDAGELLRACRLSVWDFDHLLVSQPAFERYHRLTDLSPWIDISAGWEAYRKSMRSSGAHEMRQTERKARKLATDVGPWRFEADSDSGAAFEAMLAWKAAQFHRTGITNVFSFPWTVELLRTIQRQRDAAFAGMLSVLWCGERPVAVHFGMRSGPVLHLWFPAFDRDLAQFSPGRILMRELLRSAPELGLCKIDLGRGMAEYKARLMSHTVSVAEGSVDLRGAARRLRNAWLDTKDRIRNSPLHGPARLSGRMFHRWRDWWMFR